MKIEQPTYLIGDSAERLNEIDDESVDLIVTSPPYNIGKEYEKDQRLPLKEYIDSIFPIIELCHAKLKPTGSICWQTGSFVDRDRSIHPLDVYFFPKFIALGMKPRNRIIWRFNFGLHAQTRLSGRYETMLWFSKSSNWKFNLEAIRVPQLYPGKRHSSHKGDRAGQPSGNQSGKNPSDFWEFEPERAFADANVWDLPNVKANHPEKTSHPCQFPIELAERCVLAFSDGGDVVLDPFLGAGSTAIAAIKHHRIPVGIDRDEKYIEIARQRQEKFERGELPMRPSGAPVRRPRLTERVAQIPEEWRVLKDAAE